MSSINVEAFETKGGPGAVYPALEALQVGKHIGNPVHQDVTKEGLYFLKESTKQHLADVHVDMERDQSSINHFDNCEFRGTINHINGFYRTAVINLNPDNPNLTAAANAFGSALHPIQDFYSHSNWIEMGKTGLVDPWYSYWRDIGPFSYTSHTDTLVFSLEVPPDGNTRSVFYASNALSIPSEEYGRGDSSGSFIDKTIRVKENNTSYPRVGLISGTYGEPEENRCPSDASIPHGSVIRPAYTYADDETIDHPGELNKDHPERKGHAAARELSVTQTTHEFCRLIELVRGTHGERGVQLVFDNWVQDKTQANIACPPVDVTYLTLPGSAGVHVANGKEIELNGGIVGFPDGAVRFNDGTVILPDRSVIDTFGKKWDPIPKVDPRQAIAVLPDGTQVQISTITVQENNQPGEDINSDSTISKKAEDIPSWVKTNAFWWSEGLIGDEEFALGIGFLAKERIIKVGEENFDSKGDLKIAPDIKIPDWIKTNAKWWSEDLISDDDFKQGIQYLFRAKIIDLNPSHVNKLELPPGTSKIPQTELPQMPIEPTSQSMDKTKWYVIAHNLSPESGVFPTVYEIKKWNEYAMKKLVKIKDFESTYLNDLSKEAWNEYSKMDKDEKSRTIQFIQLLEEYYEQTQKDALYAVEVLKKSNQSAEEIKQIAKEQGIDVLDLEKNTSEIQKQIDDMPNIKSAGELEKAYKDAEAAQDEMKKEIRYLEQLDIELDVAITNLSDNYWLMTHNPLHNYTVPLFDDGPISKGGHEPKDSQPDDNIWGTIVDFLNSGKPFDEDPKFTYQINCHLTDEWSWPVGNGNFYVPPSETCQSTNLSTELEDTTIGTIRVFNNPSEYPQDSSGMAIFSSVSDLERFLAMNGTIPLEGVVISPPVLRDPPVHSILFDLTYRGDEPLFGPFGPDLQRKAEIEFFKKFGNNAIFDIFLNFFALKAHQIITDSSGYQEFEENGELFCSIISRWDESEYVLESDLQWSGECIFKDCEKCLIDLPDSKQDKVTESDDNSSDLDSKPDTPPLPESSISESPSPESNHYTGTIKVSSIDGPISGGFAGIGDDISVEFKIKNDLVPSTCTSDFCIYNYDSNLELTVQINSHTSITSSCALGIVNNNPIDNQILDTFTISCPNMGTSLPNIAQMTHSGSLFELKGDSSIISDASKFPTTEQIANLGSSITEIAYQDPETFEIHFIKGNGNGVLPK